LPRPQRSHGLRPISTVGSGPFGETHMSIGWCLRLRDPLGRALVAAAMAALAASEAGAQAPIVHPGAPGEPSRVISAEAAADLASIQFVDADVKFMQGMIPHHAQALDMTALVEERSRRPAMLQLAERIERSQQDEIAMMQDWLGGRGLPVPDLHAHHEAGFE